MRFKSVLVLTDFKCTPGKGEDGVLAGIVHDEKAVDCCAASSIRLPPRVNLNALIISTSVTVLSKDKVI